MKRVLAWFLFAGTLSHGIAAAQDLPSPLPGRLVHDLANVIPSNVEDPLETKLQAYERSVGIELAVVTVPAMGGTHVDDYALRLFEKWGIGKRGKDNGILFLIGFDPAGNGVRIEVGYGLEADLTDGAAGRILDGNVMDHLKRKDYGAAATSGADAILAHLGSTPFEARAREREDAAKRRAEEARLAAENFSAVLVALGVFALIGGIVFAIVRYFKRRRMCRELRAENKERLRSLRDATQALIRLRVEASKAIDKIPSPSPRTISYLDNLVVQGSPSGVPDRFSDLPPVADLETEKGHADRLDTWLQALKKATQALEAAVETPDVLARSLQAANGDFARLPLLLELRGRVERAAASAKSERHLLAQEFPGAKKIDLDPLFEKARKLQNSDPLGEIEAALAKGAGHALDVHDLIRTFREDLQQVESLPLIIKERREAQADSKRKYPEVLEKIRAQLLLAEGEAGDSDVERSTKSDLETLRGTVQTLFAASPVPVDWQKRLKLAYEHLELIEVVRRRIARDIQDAEDARDRARERAASYSNSDSSGGSSGFGGFGGGRSGGGGASRSF